MADAVAVERFTTIDSFAEHVGDSRAIQHVFMLPSWLKAWKHAFDSQDELYLCLMKIREELIGVASLSITGATASFVGDPEISDYMDFAVVPGYEREFYHALLDDLAKEQVTKLDLRCLRPESTVFSHLVEAARDRKGSSSCEPDGVTLEMDLPGDWSEYLNRLDRKQRHEVRRKLRRLHEAAKVRFRALEDAAEIVGRLDVFLKMFRESRPDKAAFMNSRMESFFREMIRATAEKGLIRLFLLELNDSPAAAALCFDYRDTLFLYNSGYDPRYRSLSVGLLCKILSIKHGIAIGRKKYDFLKGAEPYKYYLGGNEVRLSRCRIAF